MSGISMSRISIMSDILSRYVRMDMQAVLRIFGNTDLNVDRQDTIRLDAAICIRAGYLIMLAAPNLEAQSTQIACYFLNSSTEPFMQMSQPRPQP